MSLSLGRFLVTEFVFWRSSINLTTVTQREFRITRSQPLELWLLTQTKEENDALKMLLVGQKQFWESVWTIWLKLSFIIAQWGTKYYVEREESISKGKKKIPHMLCLRSWNLKVFHGQPPFSFSIWSSFVVFIVRV